MKNTYIVYAKRTPMGKINGILSPVRVDDLMSYLFADVKSWANFDLSEVDDVIVGCANQAGEDNRNLARMSLLLAGFPMDVPGTTINRLCGSSLDAVIGAAGRISMGLADAIVVGGAESMTRAPYALSKTERAHGRDQKLYDTSLGWRFPNPRMKEMFPLFAMGETAEEVAELHKVSRDDQDEFAYNSHQKALKAQREGAFKDEILPVKIKTRKETIIVDTDECPRPDTNIEKLGKLRAVFREGGSVTAGNSSPMNDGASCVVVVSESFLKKHNLKPMLKITGAGIRGVHPNTMGLGPIFATRNLCERFDKKVSDFDIIELNEAFAAQSLACIRELELDPSIVNMKGGAIALGHPLGCSGARILTTLAYSMRDNKKLKQGLATMCIGVGQGIALSVENCN
ncbi:MAG: 3-oxoadipyl-CoA thiolase [Epsilonproteobacteria bacterium]|nr:MAG: 3-oxoadipyl-CoA thiolase [Campylobacterota bacterium]RLA68142.1 MAG: 3-oxoadipyl-CoA thiolase [Campylobacterota bacterium]